MIAEYVWIDASNGVRSKCKVRLSLPKHLSASARKGPRGCEAKLLGNLKPWLDNCRERLLRNARSVTKDAHHSTVTRGILQLPKVSMASQLWPGSALERSCDVATNI